MYAEKKADISKPPKSKSFASCSAHKGRAKGSRWQVNNGPRGKTPSERCWLTYWISLVCWRSSCLPLNIVYVLVRVSDWFTARIRRIHNVAFCCRVSGSIQQSLSSRLSTPHFTHPSNEFSLLHDDCARSASQFVANPLPPTDQLLRLPRPSPKTWKINKKFPSDRSLVLWMGSNTFGVIRDSSLMCLYRWWLFFSYVTDTNARIRSYVLSKFPTSPPI